MYPLVVHLTDEFLRLGLSAENETREVEYCFTTFYYRIYFYKLHSHCHGDNYKKSYLGRHTS